MRGALGESLIKLDDKGRIILPAKARGALTDGVYLTRGQGECVFLFSEAQFDLYTEQNRAAAPPGMPAIAFDRVFYSGVVVQDMDKQGRVLVPPNLREYAGLSRDVAVIGLKQRLELWDAARWRAYLNDYTPQYSELSEGVR
ncbi:MAG: division/cell wall cluster transcriptional repressor MraZ [Bifidobacteriaceae bacterium]|nr:division/cell wall cluster transcriptional repressor MraZ [Bifidobacteriaceae bacterium]